MLMTLLPQQSSRAFKTILLVPILLTMTASLIARPERASGEGIDECKIINQVLNRLGHAMAINRMIIASGSDSVKVEKASAELAEQTKSYRKTKKQRSKAGCDGWNRDLLD